jgi:hypothetical protein
VPEANDQRMETPCVLEGWKLHLGSTERPQESNPVEVAEYALVNKILEEPAFAWWARHVLRKRDQIIKKVQSRYWDRMHKYGVLLPKSVDEVLRIDHNLLAECDFQRIEYYRLCTRVPGR